MTPAMRKGGKVKTFKFGMKDREKKIIKEVTK